MKRFLSSLQAVAICSLLVASGILAAIGCGQNANRAFSTVGGSIERTAGNASPEAVAVDGRKAEPAGGQPPAVEPSLPRKIVYTANIHLIVEDFQRARLDLEYLVKEHQAKGAFIGRADITGTAGSRRQGNWTIRIPVEWLDDFLDTVGKLGEVQRSTLESKDVTEEYYDIEADIRNKHVEEEAFLKLEKNAANFDQLQSAKQNVFRVRGEINRLQGRLNLLGKLASLSTVQIQMSERKDYVPETTASFGSTLGGTFNASINALVKFGKTLLIVVVAAGPWLVVFGIVFGPMLWILRRRMRTTRTVPLAEIAVPGLEQTGAE